jgi:hypothetical protein
MVTLETIRQLMTAAQAEGSALGETGADITARMVHAVVGPIDAAFAELEARVDALQAKLVEHDQRVPIPVPHVRVPMPETIGEPAPDPMPNAPMPDKEPAA